MGINVISPQSRMTLIKDETLTADATDYTFSGLSISSDVRYLLFISIKNHAGDATTYSLWYNGDTEQTHYERQSILANGAGLSASRANNGELMACEANSAGTALVYIQKDPNGYPRAFCLENGYNMASLIQFNMAHFWNSTDNITSITIHSDDADAIKAGSRFSLYKVV